MRILIVSLMLTACSAGPADTTTDAGSSDTDAGQLDRKCAPGTSCAVPKTCDELADRASCEADTTCKWFRPACTVPTLAADTCAPKAECGKDSDCATGLKCTAVATNPCSDDVTCRACSLQTSVCLPPAKAPCASAHFGRGGNCVGAADQSMPDACCSPWKCDLAEVACESVPPPCAAGTRASVHNACYGPCVAKDLCETTGAVRELCTNTGGRWNADACGHAICGGAIACDQPGTGGCDCGAGKIFGTGEGCIRSDICRSKLHEACGPQNPGPEKCEDGLNCHGFDDPSGVGSCEIDPHYSCQDPQKCPTGLQCCYVADGVTPPRYTCFASGPCPDP